ncbi:MAG: hypothetical protein HC922_04740 [Leptolyngbyaceae cyanobacterium SM2_3_12]|nr:hypothetical protein [Leptolyngbyaceae cyanobacterium SM2_3_12]
MDILIVLGAIVVAVLIFGWLLKLVKNTVQTVLLVGFILLALYVVFGIGPVDLLEQLQTWLGNIQGN